MRHKPTDGYADRLTKARTEGPNPMSVRGLHRAVKQSFPDLRGTSYGGIRQYAEGKVKNPRVELLRAIAEVLGVRGDWLAFGEGPRTKEEEAKEAARVAVQASEYEESESFKRWQSIYLAIGAAERKLPLLRNTRYPNIRDAVLEDITMELFASGGRPLESYNDRYVADAVYLVAWLLTLPAAILSGTRQEIDDGYFMAMATAFLSVMAGPGEGSPLFTLAHLRGAKELWDERFPFKITDEAHEELVRNGGSHQQTNSESQEDADA